MEAVCETKIRRALLEELDQAFAMVTEYYEAERVVVREDREAFRQQYFSDDAGVWLASCDGEDVGCIALRSLDAASKSSEIKRLYVRPAYRGRGVADLLLQELEDFARKSGYAWIYLDTAAHMLAAARFYERHQFERCEKYNDNPQAALFMRKRLRGDSAK
jgi:ribosomal protein S18 acetylase RimI-like enzyme